MGAARGRRFSFARPALNDRRSNGAARHFQISRVTGKRNLQAVSRALGRLALDHRKDGDHACACDDHLLCLSLGTCARDAGAAPRSRSASRRVARSWDHVFNRGFISSGVLRRHRSFFSPASVFPGRICSACAYCRGEALFASRHSRQLRSISSWRAGLLLLVIAKDDSLFLPRYAVAWLGANLDGAAILFLFDAIYDRLRSGLRVAGGGFSPRALRLDHLQVYGAHQALRDRAHFYPGDNHHADAGHPDVDRDGAPDVSALRKLHLDCLDHGAPQIEIDRLLIAWTIRFTNISSAYLLSFSGPQSAPF